MLNPFLPLSGNNSLGICDQLQEIKLCFYVSATLYVNFNASTHRLKRVNFSGHRKDGESEMELDTPTEVRQVLDTPEGEGRKADRVGTI